jgi:hypothetical protein
VQLLEGSDEGFVFCDLLLEPLDGQIPEIVCNQFLSLGLTGDRIAPLLSSESTLRDGCVLW